MREILLTNQFKESEMFFSWTKMGTYFSCGEGYSVTSVFKYVFLVGSFSQRLIKIGAQSVQSFLNSEYVLTSKAELLICVFT